MSNRALGKIEEEEEEEVGKGGEGDKKTQVKKFHALAKVRLVCRQYITHANVP